MAILKYHFIALIRNKSLLFWALIFPIGLSTFMSMSVAKAYNIMIELEPVQIGIVNSEEMKQDLTFESVLAEVSQGDDALFIISYMDSEEAKVALQEEEITGYITKTDTFQVTVKSSGVEQTILHTFMNEYQQKEAMVYDALAHGASYETIQEVFRDTTSYRNEGTVTSGDTGVIYYYAILAMAMLYGAFWSIRLMHNQRADHSDLGQRNALSPTPRAKLLGVDFLISVGIQFIIQILLLMYMQVVLGVDFGDSLVSTLLLTFIGTMAGNSIGVVVSMYGPKTYDAAMSVTSGVVLVSCALAGLMMVELKYIIATNLPWLAAINPGTLITDAFYAQIYYGVGDRFYNNLTMLLVFTCVCYGVSFLRLRRKQYASL